MLLAKQDIFASKYQLSERCLLLMYQSCLMLANDFKMRGLEWTEEERKLDSAWQATVQLLEETRLKALQYYFQKQNSFSLQTRVS